MSKPDGSLIPSATSWQKRIHELQAILKEIRPQLVAAEQQLGEQLAEISSFEFLVRAHLEPLNRRLDKLEREIKVLQTKLRRMRADYFIADAFDGGDLYEAWRSSEEAGSAAAGDFRYHEAPTIPVQQTLSSDQSEDLKNIYRKLAWRFHPDFAMDEADRAYRTGIMMAINAAYTAGDLARLQELAEQPDPQRPDYTDEEMAEALLREVQHCKRRIAEIENELTRLHRHPSSILKKRVDEAALLGLDLLNQLVNDLRDKISEQLVHRDVLQAEIEAFESGQPEFVDDSFADAVFNLGLEQALIEDPDNGVSEWRDRNRDRIDFNESDVEEDWESLRKARDKK